jgi:hypothetical protein
MIEWFQLATRPLVARRALAYAVVVGAVLIAINHGDAILRGDISVARQLRMALTVTVPYVVSTASSVGALRSARSALTTPSGKHSVRDGTPLES